MLPVELFMNWIENFDGKKCPDHLIIILRLVDHLIVGHSLALPPLILRTCVDPLFLLLGFVLIP